MRVLKWLGILIVVVVLAIAGTFFGARLHDGPLGPLPGGPLQGGPLVADPVGDWTFVADILEIELQLTADSTSRTVWLVVDEGMAFIPASLRYPPGKRWHLRADTRGDAMLRILGRRYPVVLARVTDPERARAIAAVLVEKYASQVSPEMRESLMGPAGGDVMDAVWIFEVRSREGAASTDAPAG